MLPPIRKSGARLKRLTQDEGFKPDDDPREILRTKVFRWVNTRLGWPLTAAICVLVVIWLGWSDIVARPGMEALQTRLAELKSLPQARGERFSIMIPLLENDKDGVHRRLISDALRAQFGKDEVEVLLLERSITINGNEKPQEAVKAGHERARSLLREAHANVMIWGQVLDAKTEAPMRLHWTLDAGATPAKTSDKYRPSDANYDLPALFWADLTNVLSLLARSQAAAFSDQSGSFVANQLEPFIERVRQLIASGKLEGLQKASMQVVLAGGLLTVGEQRGDGHALDEAVSAYREALKEGTRERVPLDWARTQNNLGSALGSLGERESGTARLGEAVSAYREALKERTRERVPLDWAITQYNLGNALQTLGARESGTTRLDEAVSAYREALKEFSGVHSDYYPPMVKKNLEETEKTLALRREAGKPRS